MPLGCGEYINRSLLLCPMQEFLLRAMGMAPPYLFGRSPISSTHIQISRPSGMAIYSQRFTACPTTSEARSPRYQEVHNSSMRTLIIRTTMCWKQRRLKRTVVHGMHQRMDGEAQAFLYPSQSFPKGRQRRPEEGRLTDRTSKVKMNRVQSMQLKASGTARLYL